MLYNKTRIHKIEFRSLWRRTSIDEELWISWPDEHLRCLLISSFISNFIYWEFFFVHKIYYCAYT